MVFHHNQNFILSFLSTAREGNVFIGVYHSVHNRPHGYSVKHFFYGNELEFFYLCLFAAPPRNVAN